MTKTAPVDMEIIETALNNYTIATIIVEKHSHTALLELYANGREIPVYFMEMNTAHRINAVIGSVDRLIIFRGAAGEFDAIERVAIRDRVVVDVVAV